MWRKKKWVIIGVVAAVVILAVGILGGVAYAQSSPTPTGADQGKTLMGRVATILGIDQKKVEDAFSQAQKDMRTEAEKARLDQMVKNGKLTQKQADDYQSWMNSKPDVPAIPNAEPGMGKGRMGGFGGGFPCFPGKMGANAPSPSASPTN
jgi:hypothetical protein